jgi:hypothetical protein
MRGKVGKPVIEGIAHAALESCVPQRFLDADEARLGRIGSVTERSMARPPGSPTRKMIFEFRRAAFIDYHRFLDSRACFIKIFVVEARHMERAALSILQLLSRIPRMLRNFAARLEPFSYNNQRIACCFENQGYSFA